MTDRTRARALAKEAVSAGRPVEWFDRLYEEAEAGTAIVPWDDGVPNPHLVEWLDEYPAEGRALDVGCGYGYNAAELQRRGLEVVGFDVSPAAISRAKVIHPRLSLEVANAVGLSDAWKSSFDLVVEIYTLQVLPPALRARVARSLRDCVAPGGRLLIVARGRDEHDPEGAMPWPLTRRELEELENESFTLASFRDFMDDEDPPVRRFVAELVRASE